MSNGVSQLLCKVKKKDVHFLKNFRPNLATNSGTYNGE